MIWFHAIELVDGTVTPGFTDYRGALGERFLVPADLDGKTVLDMGTYDGFWAIEAKRRGATVIATDRFGPPLATAERALGGYGIPYECSGDLDFPVDRPWWYDRFDYVLFFGILYHLKNPFMGLWNAARFCKPGGTVLVETAISQGKAALLPFDVPALWVIDEVHAGDATNYYCPNKAGAVQLCKTAGLEIEHECEVLESFNSRLTLQCRKPT